MTMETILTWLLPHQRHDCAGHPGCQRGSLLAHPHGIHAITYSNEYCIKSAPGL
jgi:hypothetical protein